MWQRLITELPSFLGYYNLLFLAKAAFATIALSALGSIAGVIAGLGLALVRQTQGFFLAPARWLAILLTELFRRIPFLVTLMLVFYATQLTGLDLPLFVVALTAVFLVAASYLAEIIRAGFESVHRNQWDAAVAMNFTMLQTVRYVILPQAWRVILPPAFGFFVLFIKDTALASQIGILELTYAGKVLNNKGYSAALVFGTLLLLYFVISYPLTRLGGYLESRLATSRPR
jgi:polar amino acid transport system permease protein